MAYSFKIDGEVFGYTADASEARAYAFLVGAPQIAYARQHPPGVDGNATARLGRSGQIILVVIRYIGNIDIVDGWVEADKEAWENVTLTSPSGKEYERCKLQDCQESKPEPWGSTLNPNWIMKQVQYTFLRDS